MLTVDNNTLGELPTFGSGAYMCVLAGRVNIQNLVYFFATFVLTVERDGIREVVRYDQGVYAFLGLGT